MKLKLKPNLLAPVLLFWAFTHADHGGGFWTAIGFYQFPDIYHTLMADIYAGINPMVFVLILTAITYAIIFAATRPLKLLNKRKAGPGASS